jgi:P2 family phage contractile tail tube protein
MAARDVLKNINLFVDGRGYAGQVEELTPPKLTLKTEEFRAGGMDAPLELTMGMEKLEADFTLISYDRDVLAQFGVAEGFNVPFVMRGALESLDGTVRPVVITLRGKIKELDSGTFKPGEKPSLKVTMALGYYRMEHGSTTVHEIDVENMVRVVNGVDALAQTRAALGL